MNLFSFRRVAGPASVAYPGWGWSRLYGALAISCLLHASLFLVPYLGASSSGSRSGAPPRVLDVTLPRPPSGAAAAIGQQPAPGERAAAPPADSKRTHGPDLLPLPAPTYYTAAQLSTPPRPTSQPAVEVPQIARSVSGRVVLKLWISELGDVDSVEVEVSDLPPKVSRTAASAFAKLRFLPGEIDGRRVPSMIRIELTYGRGGKRPS